MRRKDGRYGEGGKEELSHNNEVERRTFQRSGGTSVSIARCPDQRRPSVFSRGGGVPLAKRKKVAPERKKRNTY